MLDLIRKGWRRIVRFFLSGKASSDRDVGESTGTASPVSARVEVSPDHDVVERTGAASPVSARVEASPDREVGETTGQEIPVTTQSTSPVSASVEASPNQDVVERTGSAPPVSARMEGSPDQDVADRTSEDTPVTTYSTSPVSARIEVSPNQEIVKCTGTAHPADTLSPPSIPTARTALPYDFSRWTITEYLESPFEKVGRLYIEGNDLVIRSDLDTRGFRIRLADVVAVLNGEPQDIRLLKTGKKVGTARLSASGKAMNFLIEPFLYTSPLARVMDVLEGRAGKAAVFVGREVVEG